MGSFAVRRVETAQVREGGDAGQGQPLVFERTVEGCDVRGRRTGIHGQRQPVAACVTEYGAIGRFVVREEPDAFGKADERIGKHAAGPGHGHGSFLVIGRLPMRGGSGAIISDRFAMTMRAVMRLIIRRNAAVGHARECRHKMCSQSVRQRICTAASKDEALLQ